MKVRNPNLQRIIESHVQEWFIKEKEKKERKKKPVITLSRQYGAAGMQVAEKLSKKLGWPFYDRNIIKEVAGLAGVRKKEFEFLDERSRNTFLEFARIFSQSQEISQDEYVKYLKKFIQTLSETGSSVIVGRGANFIVPSNGALRVRLIGDEKSCAMYAAQTYGIDEKECLAKLPSWEKERQDFVKRYFKKDINDPQYYDIVVNITYFDVDTIVELILLAYKNKFPKVL